MKHKKLEDWEKVNLRNLLEWWDHQRQNPKGRVPMKFDTAIRILRRIASV